ncbi:unnamed protein product [Periconia digitata]|uniref:Uncharacterized protein n=1 Tax=Periconia digitata TaxID=1303443 RepID=A0A9W4UWA2_9PLEO|nr:unnamed protein product [Periconia digitata]
MRLSSLHRQGRVMRILVPIYCICSINLSRWRLVLELGWEKLRPDGREANHASSCSHKPVIVCCACFQDVATTLAEYSSAIASWVIKPICTLAFKNEPAFEGSPVAGAAREVSYRNPALLYRSWN